VPYRRHNSGRITAAFPSPTLQDARIKQGEETYMGKSNNVTKDPLRVVKHPQGFHFYTAIGDYCGVSAHSLEEFADALQYVCSTAIVFHFERGDFQNWIREVIGDAELAQSVDAIKKCERHLAADSCRKELVDAVSVRILQLEANRGPPVFGGQKEKKPIRPV
jgi:hypothetical protein